MSRARKILRFTFWTNNLTLLLIMIPMLPIIALSPTRYHRSNFTERRVSIVVPDS